jgi:hypothetical protein
MKMKKTIEFGIEGGGSLFVETSEQGSGGWAPASRGGCKVLGKASESLEDALSAIKPVADAVLKTLKTVAESPDEIEAEFGIRIDGTLGGVLVSAAADAHCNVKLLWKKSNETGRLI